MQSVVLDVTHWELKIKTGEMLVQTFFYELHEVVLQRLSPGTSSEPAAAASAFSVKKEQIDVFCTCKRNHLGAVGHLFCCDHSITK